MYAWQRRIHVLSDREDKRALYTKKNKSNNTKSDDGIGMADWRNRHAFLCKTIAILLVIAFVLYDITWAQGGTPIWGHAKPSIPLNGKNELNGIKVPYHAGQAEDVYSNGGDKVIINICTMTKPLSPANILFSCQAMYYSGKKLFLTSTAELRYEHNSHQVDTKFPSLPLPAWCDPCHHNLYNKSAERRWTYC